MQHDLTLLFKQKPDGLELYLIEKLGFERISDRGSDKQYQIQYCYDKGSSNEIWFNYFPNSDTNPASQLIGGLIHSQGYFQTKTDIGNDVMIKLALKLKYHYKGSVLYDPQEGKVIVDSLKEILNSFERIYSTIESKICEVIDDLIPKRRSSRMAIGFALDLIRLLPFIPAAHNIPYYSGITANTIDFFASVFQYFYTVNLIENVNLNSGRILGGINTWQPTIPITTIVAAVAPVDT